MVVYDLIWIHEILKLTPAFLVTEMVRKSWSLELRIKNPAYFTPAFVWTEMDQNPETYLIGFWEINCCINYWWSVLLRIRFYRFYISFDHASKQPHDFYFPISKRQSTHLFRVTIDQFFYRLIIFCQTQNCRFTR